jgi:hypothetical protein
MKVHLQDYGCARLAATKAERETGLYNLIPQRRYGTL